MTTITFDKGDVLLVHEDLDKVVSGLATPGDSQWPCFTATDSGTNFETYINPASVRYVQESPS